MESSRDGTLTNNRECGTETFENLETQEEPLSGPHGVPALFKNIYIDATQSRVQ